MSDIRDISSLPLARSTVDTLLKHGFRYVKDILDMKPMELSQELKVTPNISLSILKCAKESALLSTKSTQNDESNDNAQENTGLDEVSFTAKDLLSKMSANRHIITFCKEMDSMLGGGIPIGQITEICGVPGVCFSYYFLLFIYSYHVFHRLVRLNSVFNLL